LPGIPIFTLVNLLSHYYIDRNHPSAYFKLGVLVPDIYRNFNRDLRKAFFNAADVAESEHLQLVHGVQKHYQVDAAFHNLAEFKALTGMLEQALERTPLIGSYPRKFFLCHLWLEWMLDRVLMKHFPALAVQFYHDMDTIDQEVLHRWFRGIGKEAEGNVFFVNFNRLKENKYLYLFPDNEKFINALMSVYMRVIPGVNIPPQDADYLQAITTETETAYDARLLNVYNNFSSTNL
jgi:hypothetical protein